MVGREDSPAMALAVVRLSARTLADAVKAFLADGTTASIEHLRAAHDAYRAAIDAAAWTPQRRGW